MSADVEKLIEGLNAHIPDAKKGLPQDIFFFVSRLTPMVNVDLFVKNDRKQTLLVFRQDRYYRGWHVAGGIIRFKERIADRIWAVAQNEYGAAVEWDPVPMDMHEKFASDRDIRGHFISILYRCHLLSPLDEKLRCQDPTNPDPNQWMWHDRCPENLIHQHDVYRKYIDA